MNVDEILARHRPEAQLRADRHTTMLAALDTPDVKISLVGPDPRVTTPGSKRHRWLPAVAAAVTVLAGAGGIAAWRAGGSGEDGAPAAGSAAAVCVGTMPPAWASARSNTPLRVDGDNAVPHVGTPGGDLLLSWNPTPATIAIGLRAKDGAVTEVGSFPQSKSGGLGLDATDGKHIVLTSSPSVSSAPNDVVLVDVATKARIHLLRRAPIPTGWVVRSDIALQGGYVYWGMTPPNVDSHGLVMRYSIANRAYRVIARPHQFPEVDSDARGVAWPGGAVYRKGLPAALNPILDQSGQPIDRLVTDGHAFAWQLIKGDQSVFHWVDSSGTARTFRMSLGAGHDGAALTAVSGPFLFFHVNQSNHTESVLDTRTGALAPTRLDETAWSYSGRYLFTQAGGFDYHELNTSALPGFGCN